MIRIANQVSMNATFLQKLTHVHRALILPDDPGERRAGALHVVAHAAGEQRKRFKRRFPIGYKLTRIALALALVAWLVSPWLPRVTVCCGSRMALASPCGVW